MEMRLYDYWRSSASYRVRIALNIKGLTFEQIPVDLRAGGQRTEEYLAVNPQALLPFFESGDVKISQSLAIIDYLEELHPTPAVLPNDAAGRAYVRSMAQIIACDIHPLNNQRVISYLEKDLGCDQLKRMIWYHRWIADGFKALEAAAKAAPGDFCYGDEPTLADICLVPQVYNAKRYEVDLGPFPTLRTINDRCQEIEAFAMAAPQHQPGA